MDPKTGTEKLILRGTKHCKELNINNHRVHCCHTNNCNRWLPQITIQTDIYSNHQRRLPSMILLSFFVIFQYFYQQK
jgi:hypothetical protein